MRTLICLFGFVLTSINVLSQSGALDPTFNPANGPQRVVWALSVQSDGKILVGGSDDMGGSGKLERYHSDGGKDGGFATGMSVGNIFFTEMQPGNKILVSGEFGVYNAFSIKNLVRLHPSGVADGTFNPGTFASGGVWSTLTEPDGKIFIAGNFKNHWGGKSYLSRINSNGSWDNSFSTGVGPDSAAYSIARYSDGKILVGGYFTTYNGISRNRVMRLNTDGSLDLSFNPGTGADGNIYQVLIQPDQKVIIAGDFLKYNGISRPRIARLNADGSLDLTFTPGLGANKQIYSAVLEPDGRIVIVGDFTSFNNTPSNRIARLRTNGTPDPEFTMGLGVNGPVYYAVAQPDGMILIGGEFSSYNIEQRKNVARIRAATPTGIQHLDLSIAKQELYPNPVVDDIILRIQTSGSREVTWVITDINGKNVMTKAGRLKKGENKIAFNVSKLTPGNYYITGFTSGGKTMSMPFIKK